MFDTIAVGVDGSEASLQALRWALDAAALHDADRDRGDRQPHRDPVPVVRRRQARPTPSRDEYVAGRPGGDPPIRSAGGSRGEVDRGQPHRGVC